MAILRLTLAMASASIAVMAQSPGNGISKQTYASTDPQGSFTWLAKYFPMQCGDSTAMCNSTDAECGQKGRGNLCPETGCDETSAFSSLMWHQVNCSSRPSGPTTVAQVEAIFDDKLNAAFKAKRYDAFMDFALAVWATDLDLYLAKFLADDVPFLAIHWKDDKSTDYWSVIAHSPHTQVIVELISSVMPSKVTDFFEDATLRYTSGIFVEMGATAAAVDSAYLRPLAIVKATSDVSAIVDFYENALFATVEWNVTYADGTRYVYLNPGFASMSAKMQVVFRQRPASATTSVLSVKGLEDIKFAGHDVVHDSDDGTTNLICGFDKWYDNRYGIDGGTTTLDEYRAAFDQRGWRYYHAWGGGQGPENIYVVDPTGDAIQLDAQWANGAPAGVADDALGTMCSQGNCAAGSEYIRATPAACAAAIAAACPDLKGQFSTCSDCVYAAGNWAGLKKASCLNADVVTYCVGS